MQEKNTKKIYDVIIVGGGPAGLTASIYLSRYRVSHALVAPEIGGFMNETHKIENYPGFISISGFELSQKMGEHTKALGAEIISEEVSSIEKVDDNFKVTTFLKNELLAKRIIYAVGTISNKLNVPGENNLKGKGVSYCATCDGPFFKNKEAVVVGGGNSAAVAAFILAKYANKVTLIHRGDNPTCEPAYIKDMQADPKIVLMPNTNVIEIQGETKVEKVILDKEIKGSNEYETDGIFIEIGSGPNTASIKKIGVELNDKGYIKVNPDQESTNTKDFYAVGDISTNSNGIRQIVTAASEGSIAAMTIFEKNKKNNK